MRNTGVVRTYGQYCPIARGAEIFAERWTPLIIRNLYLGCGSFSEILEGAPGLSRTLLSQRLKQLERLGVVESAPKPDGRGHHYELTSAGHDLFTVCQSLGEWGARWLEIAPENLDPFVALWSMCNALRRDRLPDRRVVIRFDFTGRPRRERYWLLIELGDTEICKTYPGLDEDLYITAEAEAFVKWHAGQLTWAQATREGRIQLDGLPVAGKSLPNLERPQHVRPHQAGLAASASGAGLTERRREDPAMRGDVRRIAPAERTEGAATPAWSASRRSRPMACGRATSERRPGWCPAGITTARTRRRSTSCPADCEWSLAPMAAARSRPSRATSSTSRRGLSTARATWPMSSRRSWWFDQGLASRSSTSTGRHQRRADPRATAKRR